MVRTSSTIRLSHPSDPSTFDAVKARQRAAWTAGDYAVIGTTLQIVGEQLCEALDVRAGQRVLDVAAGNGNASLAAARRGCDVVSTDYVPALLDGGRQRAAAERLAIDFRVADAESLPFGDDTFDAVVSTFGVMFTPDQEQAALELQRVCRPGGKIGLASWTPDGFIGQVFTTIDTQLRSFVFRYRSPAHWLEVFRGVYGPMQKAFAALELPAQAALTAELIALVNQFQRSGRTMVVPSEYLEVIVTLR